MRTSITEFDKAITLDPHNADALYNRGLIYQTQRQHQLAIDDFTSASGLTPQRPEPLLARAISLRVGRLEEAAWRVAEGDFGARFAVDSEDELGQLARALDSMQRQLAELDSARERFI